MTPAILSALADGATAITPNRRLARQLRRDFDRAQLACGRRAWPTASVLPYATWLETLWQQRTDTSADADAATLLAPQQCAQVWRRVVDADSTMLLDPASAARLCAEAWTLVHGWGAGGQSWRGWRRDDDGADDPAMFAAWAEAYSGELRRMGALDSAQLPDRLVQDARHLACRSVRAILVGFLEHTPQQQRLIAALTAAGADLRSVDALPERIPAAWRTTVGSARDELIAALTWARSEALRHPDARIGVVIEDLAARRDEVVSLADALLCPELALPGQRVTRRPYEISLGTPLADVPLVMAALGLIVLGEAQLPAGEAAALLRSPYLPDAEREWSARAAIERDWLELGQRDVMLDDAIAALAARSPELAARWRTACAVLRKSAGASPRTWVDSWRSWLPGSGWPGMRKLDSVEHQAREAWEALLGDFLRLGAVTARLTRGEALRILHGLARDRVFQPEGTDAPIQLLGLLEGSGLAFDALWVVGLSADRWPPAPSPNPLLPLHWQRERGVPRCNAERELAHARALTLRYAAAAPTVVFSNAAVIDDLPRTPSVLLLDFPELAAPASAAPTWTQAIAEGRALEKVDDDRAPPLAPGTAAPGGGGIVAAQSDCPFRAVARHRLRLEPWPRAPSGLSARERGVLLHDAMAALWQGLRDQATLARLDVAARTGHIEAAVAAALARFSAVRWRMVPAIVRGGEAQRIAALLKAWLPVELTRAAFAVAGTEIETSVNLGELQFRLRIDRVDACADGGVVIIDYKSGRCESAKQWFDERPRASQLGLYALAQRAARPDQSVRALAFAQLRPEAIAALGLAVDESVWPGITALQEIGRFADWSAVEAWWRARLGALAAEIATGWAAVVPRRSPSPCRQCGLQAFCRIDSVQLAEESDRIDE